jgi:hypothetical protein
MLITNSSVSLCLVSCNTRNNCFRTLVLQENLNLLQSNHSIIFSVSVALADHYVAAIETYEVIEVNDACKAVAKIENA